MSDRDDLGGTPAHDAAEQGQVGQFIITAVVKDGAHFSRWKHWSFW